MFLTPDNQLSAPLWVDQPDAIAQLEAKIRRGEISDGDGAAIRHFIDHGYAVLDVPGLDDVIENLACGVEELWRTRPADVLMAAPIRGGRLFPMSVLAAETGRGPGVRIIDMHSHVEAARQLYLNAELHRICDLVFGAKPVATQSLYFEYGSLQPLHRDPWFVNHSPRTHLLAAWWALEDIHLDSGPLSYVPGSHRLPFYRFSTDDVVFHDPRVEEHERRAARQHLQDQISNREVVRFSAKKGQVLLWHSALVHGGSPVLDATRTRRSFVVHFGRLDTHSRRGTSFGTEDGPKVAYTTNKYVSDDGSIGFHSPMCD